MIVDDLKNPNGMVLTVKTKEFPFKPSRILTGVVIQGDFAILTGDSVTGETFPLNCVTIGLSKVIRYWSSLREYYNSEITE